MNNESKINLYAFLHNKYDKLSKSNINVIDKNMYKYKADKYKNKFYNLSGGRLNINDSSILENGKFEYKAMKYEYKLNQLQ